MLLLLLLFIVAGCNQNANARKLNERANVGDHGGTTYWTAARIVIARNGSNNERMQCVE